jgi:hypothetical protein
MSYVDVSAIAALISTIAACGAAGAALWGLRYAKGLIDSAVSDRQVDRVLALHESFTTGEIGAARIRFSSLMYHAGESAFGSRKCWRPTWESLVPPNQGPAKSGNERFLGHYPIDMDHTQNHRPIDDVRQVLWWFDRINEARKQSSSLDERLLVSLMGHSVVWWSLLCGRLDPKGGAHVHALLELAEWMEGRNWRKDPRNESRKSPEDDFPGQEDYVPPPILVPTNTGNTGVNKNKKPGSLPFGGLISFRISRGAGR